MGRACISGATVLVLEDSLPLVHVKLIIQMTWVRHEGNIIALVNQVLIPLLLRPALAGSSSSNTTTSAMGLSAWISASSVMAPTVTVEGRDVKIVPITTIGIASCLHVILTLKHGVSKVLS